MGKLNAKKLGLAGGIIGGAVVFITTLLSVTTGYGTAFLQTYSSLHPWYSISIIGAFIGLVYSFICWFVVGYVLARIYNWGAKSK
ncbi:MAG TPA: hypothetical protein VJA47_05645 [archaeon]|nr:hypothetical protein [archaeon]